MKYIYPLTLAIDVYRIEKREKISQQNKNIATELTLQSKLLDSNASTDSMNQPCPYLDVNVAESKSMNEKQMIHLDKDKNCCCPYEHIGKNDIPDSDEDEFVFL